MPLLLLLSLLPELGMLCSTGWRAGVAASTPPPFARAADASLSSRDASAPIRRLSTREAGTALVPSGRITGTGAAAGAAMLSASETVRNQ